MSDLKHWGSEAGKLYGVNSIPMSFLIDPNAPYERGDVFGGEAGVSQEVSPVDAGHGAILLPIS